MKASKIILFLLTFIILVAGITNPKKNANEVAVKEKATSYLQKQMEESLISSEDNEDLNDIQQ